VLTAVWRTSLVMPPARTLLTVTDKNPAAVLTAPMCMRQRSSLFFSIFNDLQKCGIGYVTCVGYAASNTRNFLRRVRRSQIRIIRSLAARAVESRRCDAQPVAV
jgi:hypothetical protein